MSSFLHGRWICFVFCYYYYCYWMEVVEKSIGACRGVKEEKVNLLCHHSFNSKHRNSRVFIVWGLIMIIRHHLNKQSAGQSIPWRAGSERSSAGSLLLLRESQPCEKENGAQCRSTRPISWAHRHWVSPGYNQKASLQRKACWKACPRPCPLPATGPGAASPFGGKPVSEQERAC